MKFEYEFTRDPMRIAFMRDFLTENHVTTKAALAFADIAHSGQSRKESGEPYVHHTTRVAYNMLVYMLSNHNSFADGSACIVIPAAVLHDVKEDCSRIPSKAIEEVFGYEVDMYVDDLTNRYGDGGGGTGVGGHALDRAERKTLEALRIRDISYDALAIKMMDRTDNLHDTRDSMKPAWKARYMRESRELFDWLPKRHQPLKDCLLRILTELEESCV